MEFKVFGILEQPAVHFSAEIADAIDADTAFAVSMTLAVKLANAGKQADDAFAWNQPHCEADYPGGLCDWMEGICRTQS